MRIFNQLLILLVVCTVTSLVVSRSSAQTAAQPERIAEASTCVAADPQATANPYSPVINPYVPAPVEKSNQLDRAEHLRLAAEHLTAAGKKKLAEQITSELLIETKLTQIRQLQAEVAALRDSTGAQQLMLQLKVVELQTSAIRKLGFDFQTVDGMPTDAAGISLADAEAIDGLLDALRKENLAKVIAEPTLVTVSGRPASFQSGGEIPILVPQSQGNTTVEYRQTGTRVDCVGTVLKTGRIRLELSATISEVDPFSSIVLQDITVPGLQTRKVDTAIELDAGQTVVLGGLSQTCSQKETDAEANREKTLLIAVTVNLVDRVEVTAGKDASLR